MTHQVDDQQSVVDIALQRYGSVEGVFALLADNNIRLDEQLEANATLVVDAAAADQSPEAVYYAQRGRKIATEYVPREAGAQPLTIEYSSTDYHETDYQ